MPVTTALDRRHRSWAVPAAIVAAALTMSACGGRGGPEVEAAAPTTTPATLPAETTAPTTPPTTVESTVAATNPPSTTAAPTTAAPSTLPRQASTPIAPPADARADEPVIEMGSIRIPKIDVDAVMYEGIRLSTLDFGPGHWPGSALPGEIGNVVVAGHRTSKHQVFRDLDQLVAGDQIVFADDGVEHVYRVTDVEIVGPEALWIVDPTDTPVVTLFACHPPGSTTQRIVVHADLEI